MQLAEDHANTVKLQFMLSATCSNQSGNLCLRNKAANVFFQHLLHNKSVISTKRQCRSRYKLWVQSQSWFLGSQHAGDLLDYCYFLQGLHSGLPSQVASVFSSQIRV